LVAYPMAWATSGSEKKPSHFSNKSISLPPVEGKVPVDSGFSGNHTTF
jgi:hypothetical protein